MTTQVVFNLDKKTKERAMRRAKKMGIPLSAVFKSAAYQFAEELTDFGLYREPERFNEKTRKEIAEIFDDAAHGRNLSPAFDNAADAIAYLKSGQ